MKNECKVITGMVRLSYANILEPRAMEGQEPRYSVAMLIPKEDTETMQEIDSAINAAYRNGLDKLRAGGKVPALSAIKSPVHDGDMERPDDPVYTGCWYINATCPATHQPQIVDVYKNRLTSPDVVYSGMFARVSVTFYAFNRNGNRGIACGLGNILKLADGDRLGGNSTADEDFGEFYKEPATNGQNFDTILSDGETPF